MSQAIENVEGSKEDLQCSFCGKRKAEVRKLIGTTPPRFYICDECVEYCLEVFIEDDRKHEPKAVGSLLRYVIKVTFDRPFAEKESLLLPAIIESIQAAYPGSSVSIKNFYTKEDGGVLMIFFDSPVKMPMQEIAILESEIESLSRLLKIEQEKFLAERSEKEKYASQYHELVETVFPLMVSELRKQGRLVDRQVKTMLIMFVDIVGFSSLANEERAQKLDLMRVIARSVLKSGQGLYINTWGDGLIAAFDDPTQGLRCACKFVQHLNVDGIDARIGVNWGAARISYNEVTERMDIDGASVNVGARLEPLASSGEVLASDVVVDLPDLRKNDFTFLEREAELKKAVGGYKAGDKIKVFRVNYLPNR